MSSLCCSKLFKPFSSKSFAQHFQTFFRLSKIERRESGSVNSGQIVSRIGMGSVGQLELTFRSKQHPKIPQSTTSRGRQLFGRQSFGRESFGRESFGRESFGRESFGRQSFGRQSNADTVVWSTQANENISRPTLFNA